MLSIEVNYVTYYDKLGLDLKEINKYIIQE